MTLDAREAGQVAARIAEFNGVAVHDLLRGLYPHMRRQLCAELRSNDWEGERIDQHFGWARGTAEGVLGGSDKSRLLSAPKSAPKLVLVPPPKSPVRVQDELRLKQKRAWEAAKERSRELKEEARAARRRECEERQRARDAAKLEKAAKLRAVPTAPEAQPSRDWMSGYPSSAPPKPIVVPKCDECGKVATGKFFDGQPACVACAMRERQKRARVGAEEPEKSDSTG